MNEDTHGLYYQQMLQDRNFTKNLFRQMKTCDNVTKLYFNDYQAVDIGGSTEVPTTSKVVQTNTNHKKNI